MSDEEARRLRDKEEIEAEGEESEDHVNRVEIVIGVDILEVKGKPDIERPCDYVIKRGVVGSVIDAHYLQYEEVGCLGGACELEAEEQTEQKGHEGLVDCEDEDHDHQVPYQANEDHHTLPNTVAQIQPERRAQPEADEV